MTVFANHSGSKVSFKTEDGREVFVFELNKFNQRKLSNRKLQLFALWLLNSVKVK